jgi:GntR family transcriptional regulator, transcriptional repressor for pyruvate dehydrogenase complex
MPDAIHKLDVLPLPSVNRVDAVARELERQIRSGAFEPNSRLPSEQTMAAQFGVSRAVVREAIARLKSDGLVLTKQGSGAFVQDGEITSLRLDPDIRKSLEAVLSLAELRKGIEAEAAALAAARRTRSDLKAIEKALARVAAITQARGDSARADLAFHRAIAEAAHNPFYIAVLDYLSQFLLTAIRVSRGEAVLREDFAREVEVEHLNILDAIRRKDVSAARLAAQIHMDRARIRIRQAGRDFWATNKRTSAELSNVGALKRASRMVSAAKHENVGMTETPGRSRRQAERRTKMSRRASAEERTPRTGKRSARKHGQRMAEIDDGGPDEHS